MAKPEGTVDWQDGKSLSECMTYMLEKEIMCDVTFRVGTDHSIIKAHKYMLASRSPVFYTMFEGSCPEKGEIIVTDINSATFKVLLKYIYSDVLDLSLDNIQEVLYGAEKYMLSTMKDECTSLLLSSVETSNAPGVFNVASHFHLEHLKLKSLEHIQKNATECLMAPNAIKMSKECMEAILRLDSIYCSETDICRFLIKWASHQCEAECKTASGENLREITGPLLYLVRFPLVDKEYFAKEIAHSGLMNSEEVISVFSSHYGRKNEFFAESVRNSKLCYNKKDCTVWRHRSVASPWYQHPGIEYDALNVKVNRNIELKSVILFGPVGNVPVSVRDITVKILNDGGNEIFTQKYESCTQSSELQTVLLSEPIPINANTLFTIMVDSIKFDAYYGKHCKQKCRIDHDIVITFENSPNCTTGTSVEQGQIAGIEFNA
ncbi:BTB/POZ domain-containing protein 1/2 [Mytilus galloprovincialis]|uniref:BTB/POZ domain-containing protein 1/2 n=1 Tax=Mytilus galloprovincialis TaxID=29158 RepID=A0A8B6F4Y8_MYTGA|nr:BTB/POZ domain-containing protein 1/2 [Mytilus galloprovincialis]